MLMCHRKKKKKKRRRKEEEKKKKRRRKEEEKKKKRSVIERRRRKQKKKKKQETKMTHHPIIYNPVQIYNILGIVTAFAIVIVLEFFNQRPWLLGKGTKPPREDRLTPTRSI